jgi:hypothetical protein
MEDLTHYLNEIVDPTVRDFEENPTSVRHAFIACVATFHSIDYLAYPRKSKATRERFRKASSDFSLVDDVAHAFKHVVARTRRGAERLQAGDVISRPPAHWDKAEWALSRWDDGIGGVTLDNDRNVDLLDVVKGAVEFLRSKGATQSDVRRSLDKC